MTLDKAKAKTNETFILQASLMIVTYDRKNMFIVQATSERVEKVKYFTQKPYFKKSRILKF